MEAQLTEERSPEFQTEQEKLNDVLRVLRNVVEELDTMVSYVEKEVESITTIDELVEKKKYFRIIIDVLKLLCEFPRNSVYHRKKLPPNIDPRLESFYSRMDKALFSIRAKLNVIKQYVHTCTSLSSAVTLALVLRDVKKLLVAIYETEDSKTEDVTSSPEQSVAKDVKEVPDACDSPPKEQTSPSDTPKAVHIKPLITSPLDGISKTSSLSFMDAKRLATQERELQSINLDSSKPIEADDDVAPSQEEVKERVSTILRERRNSLLSIKEDEETKRPSSPTNGNNVKLADAIEDIFSMGGASLQLIIEEPNGLKLFKNFLKKEFGEENLLFCLEINKYKEIKSTDKNALKKKAEEIIATYVADAAPKEVNLPGATKMKLMDMMQKKEITPNMFDGAQKCQMNLMQQDSFRRFVLSETFKQYTKTKSYQKMIQKYNKDKKVMAALMPALKAN